MRTLPATACALALAANTAAAQNFPDKPVTLIALFPAGNTPDELAKFLRAEMTKWGKVVKDAEIKPE